MLARNVEIKAAAPDSRRTVELALALGAQDRGELRQRDTYFTPARGRLKLREQEPGEDELIAYERPDRPDAATSAYRRVPVSEAAGLRDALDASLGTLVVVTKLRRLLVWEDVRIHVDQVEQLGGYVELEAVAAPDSDLSAEHERVTRLRAALEIGDEALVAVGYSDLLLDGRELLMRRADEAMRHAYAPYSGFKVGAALRAPSGAIYAAANVENAAYPQSQCAEASAIGALVAAGETSISAVAVTAERMDVCPPCGGCRQRLSEFAGPGTPVHLGRPGGPQRETTLAGLLPLSFDLDAG